MPYEIVEEQDAEWFAPEFQTKMEKRLAERRRVVEAKERSPRPCLDFTENLSMGRP